MVTYFGYYGHLVWWLLCIIAGRRTENKLCKLYTYQR